MSVTYSYDEAFSATIEYFKGDLLATEVFLDKYALRDDNGKFHERTPEDMHRRLAREFARIEAKYPNALSEDEIFSYLDHFRYIIPQGSPMSAIGNDKQIQSLSNCFVIESPHDSYGGIMKTDQEQAQIMKRRGGVGFDVSTIRPAGMTTSNAARSSTGLAAFMERFSNTTREVAQEGRRGALMLTCDIRHPDIERFIEIKDDKTSCKSCGHEERTRVTGANVSMRVNDEFMQAVRDDTLFELRFPVDAHEPHVKKSIRARDLWERIIDRAWSSAEPGILFWDTVRRNTPADIYVDEGFASVSTNPCGEIVLCPHDSCRLLIVNAVSFVLDPFTDHPIFDWQQFDDTVRVAQRLMDDLIDLEIEAIERIIRKIHSDPEPKEIKQIELSLWKKILTKTKTGRRTGLGITGLGDVIAMMGHRYGSDESIQLTSVIYQHLAHASHLSSIEMAEERGAFPIFDYEKEKDHPHLSKILGSHRPRWKTYGRRNISNTTTAPCGSTSIEAGVSGGIEPVVFVEGMRKRKLPKNDPRVDEVDAKGDGWQHYEFIHPGFALWRKVTGKHDYEDSPYHGSTSIDSDWVKHVDIQAAAQAWVDHSISKTCNFPKDTPKEVVARAYMRAWESGCKGFTVYREGSRSGVIVRSIEDDLIFSDHHAPKRPHELICNIHHATIQGEAWTILVGMMDDRPYEVFGGLSSTIEIPRRYKTGRVFKHPRKTIRSIYDLVLGEGEDVLKIKDIINVFDNPTDSAFTRVISLALRHGTPVQYVCEQLKKDEKNSDMFSFTRVMARVLKNYIPDGSEVCGEGQCPNCGGSKFVYQSGCVACAECAWERCD